nr:zinc finger, CCHC-type [Tanacetum cinerariifolium]
MIYQSKYQDLAIYILQKGNGDFAATFPEGNTKIIIQSDESEGEISHSFENEEGVDLTDHIDYDDVVEPVKSSFRDGPFRIWKKKMHFFLSSMSVVYVLTTPMPEDGGDNLTMEQVRKRAKWDNDDYVCRGLILNGMSNSLFDIYQNVETSKELWDTLEAKYMAEDASSERNTRKGQNRNKTGQKEEAWKSPTVSKANHSQESKKKEENTKLRGQKCKSCKLYYLKKKRRAKNANHSKLQSKGQSYHMMKVVFEKDEWCN